MSLINCELNPILTWSANCVMVSIDNANKVATFSTTKTKLFLPVVTLSTQDNANLLKQLKPDSKRTNNWNKYTLKPELLRQNGNLNHLVQPSFQGISKLFILSFEQNAQKTSSKRYYLPNVEI